MEVTNDNDCSWVKDLIPRTNIKTLQLSPSVLEELVQKHYIENKKIVSLEGNLLRLAINNKISRNEFIKFYVGNEINPNLKNFFCYQARCRNFTSPQILN